MLTFVIPVRHPESVSDWSTVRRHLDETVSSVAAQTSSAWRCVVVANEEADLPTMPDGVSTVLVNFPPAVIPRWADGAEAHNGAVRADKGSRVLAGLNAVSPGGHVMVCDHDDWVSRRLAAYVERHPDAPGWYIDRGLMSAGGRTVALQTSFDTTCGTSIIVRWDLLRLQGSDTPEEVVVRYLGSHRFVKDDLANSEQPLRPLPFLGAAYRVGTPDAASGGRGLRARKLPLRQAYHQPLRFAVNASRFRLATSTVREEFGLRSAS